MKILETRIIVANIGIAVSNRRVFRGTPQGGVISPTLWILALNEILLDLERIGVKTVAYADDLG